MARPHRRCQHCNRPLGRFARLLYTWSCNDCVYRMSHGGSPRRWQDDAPSTDTTGTKR